MDLMRQYLIIFVYGMTLLCVFAWEQNVSAQDLGVKIPKGISWEAAYSGEFRQNTQGGLKRDGTYLGNLDITLSLETQEAGWWANGNFFLYILSNHSGEKLSESIVGDLQVVSNIEAPRTTRVYELWYEHFLGNERLSLLMGIHDYNSEFNVTEYGSLYMNSSFGITPEMATGARPGIFPLAAPGLRVKWAPKEQWQFLAGIYDGDPGDPEEDEHFPRWDFDAQGGTLLSVEIAHFPIRDDRIIELPESFKVGFWYNTGEFTDLVDTDALDAPVRHDGNYGIYGIIDKILYQEDANQGLGGFLQIGVTQDDVSEVDFYIGGGINYRGLIATRDQDEFGIAVAYASISDPFAAAEGREDAETTLEITYRMPLTQNLTIQPDLQLVMNPGGDSDVDDAFIVGMRAELTLP